MVINYGRKNDQGKLPYHLLPPELLAGVAEVLAFGASKYAPRNWELGMDWSRPYDALQRHMWAWWSGEDNDPETGFSHLAHAGCCVAFLIAYERRRVGVDDRPHLTVVKEAIEIANVKIADGMHTVDAAAEDIAAMQRGMLATEADNGPA